MFITVDVDNVSGSFGTSGRITKAITDVNGVYTGVQDVDIVTKLTNRVVGDYVANDGSKPNDGDTAENWVNGADTTTNPDHNFFTDGGTKSYIGENVYAVYDKNNFIIGAVILGEAVGGTKNFAYVLDPVKNESYRDGNYYWQFEAVLNGEKVTLDAKSKFASTIDTLRNNWHDMVELRFTDDVVTEVIDVAADKIYGSPFAEITTRAVNDDAESVYDVVLTGPDHGNTNSVDQDGTADGNVRLENVFRGGPESNTTKSFTATQMGYLNLQGRTLWVLNGQADYGIDFTREAKAVVIQPENGDEKVREYDSVQGAVDSLGDPIPGNDVKEFYGIISAALNSQGVAEWVVFYSNTNVDTRNSVEGPVSYMDVIINIRLPGNDSVQYFDVAKVAKPATGSIAFVDSPDETARKDSVTTGRPIVWPVPGYRAKQTTLPVVWNKDNGATVTFDYELYVAPVTVTKIEVKTAPTKANGYKVGETLDLTGMVITITKSDGTTEDVTAIDTGFTALTAKGITMDVNALPGTYTASFDITFTHTASSQTCKQAIGMTARTGTASVGAVNGTITAGNAGTATATVTLSNGATVTGVTVSPGGAGTGVSAAMNADGVTVDITADNTVTADTYTITVNWAHEDGTAGTAATTTLTVA